MKTINLKFLSFIITLSFLVLSSCGDKKGAKKSETDLAKEATAVYEITALTNHEYTFNGGGLEKVINPDLTLKRGATYLFKIDAIGHPFYIKTVQGIGKENAYDKGVTNMATDYGTVTFTVPKDAPATLFYNCEFHKMMTGKITIVD